MCSASSDSKSGTSKKVLDENKVFVTSLPWDTTSSDLEQFFAVSCGIPVQHAEVLQRRNGLSMGCGVVTFTNASDTLLAIRLGNNQEINGRAIVVREYYQDSA